MKKNQTGSALIIGIFVTMIVLIIAIYLLDKIVPFAHDIKGVENGNISYYRANTALNEALLSMSGSNPAYETGSSTVTSASGIAYTVTATGNTLPRPGLGNSEYDPNWSILAPGRPVQLVLSNGINWIIVTGTTYFKFRVPNLDKDSGTLETLTGTTNIPIINWILSASGGSLIASGSYSTTGVYLGGSQVKANVASSGTVFFDGLPGLTLSGSADDFSTFYTNNCTGTDKCTLKLSLVNPLLLDDNITIAPYLEYQAHFSTSTPLQTAVIETQGYAGGFRKNITRFIQQMTTNEALDFTVFQ